MDTNRGWSCFPANLCIGTLPIESTAGIPVIYQANHKEISMKPVLINSLPKSGTNLVASLLDLLGYQQKIYMGATGIKVKRNPIINKYLSWKYRNHSKNMLTGVDMPEMIAGGKVKQALSMLKEGSYANIHVPFSEDFDQLVNELSLRHIVVIRDPRAVVVSGLYYILKNDKHPAHDDFKAVDKREGLSRLINDYQSETFSMLSLKERCQTVEAWRSRNSHFVRFEDLIGPRGGGDEARMVEAIEGIARVLDYDQYDMGQIKEELFGIRGTFRKGKIDSWKEDLSDAEIEGLQNAIEEVLDMWGYEKV